MKTYVFNHDYLLRHDEKRTYLVSKYRNNQSSRDWISLIHPVQAMILSHFSTPVLFDKVVEQLAYFLEIDQALVQEFIQPFVDNTEAFHTEYLGQGFDFPKHVIIESQANKSTIIPYQPEEFEYSDLDFVSKRMYSGPLNITFMPNNICATDCIYCYADKSHQVKNYINFDRVKAVLDEAVTMRVLSFNIVGGEVFTYPHWEKLLQYSIHECGYVPQRISTKVPLTKEGVLKLKRTGVNKIQVSLDTLDEQKLTILLQTKRTYKEKIMRFLEFLDEENFDIHVQTVLTKLNCTENDILSIFEFLKPLKHVSEWIVRPAFPSIYRGNDFVPGLESINDVFDAIEPLKSHITLSYDRTFVDREYVSVTGGSENFTGAECSANRSHIFILPDGKVTICEQLYWKPNFIVGDLNYQSISEVWNSRKSTWFANLDSAQLAVDNPCKSCEIFERCYKNMNRCWAEVVKAYGDEKWDYPDPRCKLAPEMTTNLIYQ
jgi:radical SAM protein with 4Fe4S-binding SPASM domain